MSTSAALWTTHYVVSFHIEQCHRSCSIALFFAYIMSTRRCTARWPLWNSDKQKVN